MAFLCTSEDSRVFGLSTEGMGLSSTKMGTLVGGNGEECIC